MYSIRPIELSDTASALEVYKPYVINTGITFEYEVPSVREFSERIKMNAADYPWLVCTKNEKITGYAYASKFRPKAAYHWSPEVTIYLAAEAQGKGIGKILYETLFDVLRLQGFVNAFAGIALPNEKSEKLHTSLGFTAIGLYKNIGFKLNQWHTTRWFQLQLADYPTPPLKLKTIQEIKNSEKLKKILDISNGKLKNIS
ncbi:MAG: N-acetyltransferase [Bacteroidetes bacterium]|nr:N-acetyltransferase [Bacteroidota bacterium]